MIDHLTALDRAGTGFLDRLGAVAPDSWARPTPCGDWDVTALVTHVVAGNRMAVALLGAATTTEAIGVLSGTTLGSDPRADAARSIADQLTALRGADLSLTVHHPAMDMPAAQLLGFRIGDLLVHAWDLARATGGDEALDPDVVEVVWSAIEPMIPMIGSVGVFGTGPSGDVGDGADLGIRLLDAMGRRP